MSFLTLDLGNTTVKAALFSGKTPRARASWSASDAPPLPPSLDSGEGPPELAAYASVNGDATLRVLHWLEEAGIRAFEVPRDLPYAIPVHMDRPDLVGPDRVAAASGALHIVKEACIVVDAGTAVTVDFASPVSGFEGGAILPGRGLMAQSLHGGTDRLPDVVPDPIDDPLGASTEEAIRIGAFMGWVGAVREIVEAMALKFGGAKVVATGGDGELLRGRIDAVEAYHGDLTLIGIRLAVEKGGERTGP
ncbi:MAG: type III pantothenate kinase [Planctomycetota bacterium]|jgi:type III pantothenate kinase